MFAKRHMVHSDGRPTSCFVTTPTLAAVRESSMASRRGFLETVGAVALAAQLDLVRSAASLLAAETAPAGQPRVAVVYFRRETGGGCVWPPSSTMELAQTQQMLNKIMQEAAAKYGVELSVLTERVIDLPATLAQVDQLKPDGLIAIGMDFDIGPWIEFCEKRGQIPTIAYGNIVHMGRNLEPLRSLPNTLLAHTPRVDWLDTGVRLFRAMWDVDHLPVLDCPGEGYYEELQAVDFFFYVKAISEFYTRHAQAIDPICQPLILDSAKHYVVLKRMMERHGCNGVAVEGPLCVGAGTDGNLPACLALSKMLDEGTVAQCQAEHGGHASAYVQRLASSLLGRPSYMGNITFDNLANRLILSHCTSALKLEGFDHDYRAPFNLRSFHANTGVSLQVSWPIGREATILDRVSMTGDKFIVAAAKVTANNDVHRQPPCGGCRTVVEYELAWAGNIMDLDIPDLHGSAVLGNFRATLIQFCRLAGLVPVDIAGNPLPV